MVLDPGTGPGGAIGDAELRDGQSGDGTRYGTDCDRLDRDQSSVEPAARERRSGSDGNGARSAAGRISGVDRPHIEYKKRTVKK